MEFIPPGTTGPPTEMYWQSAVSRKLFTRR